MSIETLEPRLADLLQTQIGLANNLRHLINAATPVYQIAASSAYRDFCQTTEELRDQLMALTVEAA